MNTVLSSPFDYCRCALAQPHTGDFGRTLSDKPSKHVTQARPSFPAGMPSSERHCRDASPALLGLVMGARGAQRQQLNDGLVSGGFEES